MTTTTVAAAPTTATTAPVATTADDRPGRNHGNDGAGGDNGNHRTGRPLRHRPPRHRTTAPPTTEPPFTPPTGLPNNATAIHVANRVTFGVTPKVIGDIAAFGTGGYVEAQLTRNSPDAQTETRLGDFNLLGMGRKATYDRLRNLDGNDVLETELNHMNLLRAVYSENQLFEMVCQMWMDHFNINLFGEGRTEHLMIDYQENVIRANAMGTFRDLLVATANSTAMLTYLNNDTSNANSPQGVNENYGRELLELHTLGIDENGNQVYNEADVRQASLAMSGWSMINDPDAANHTDFIFRDDFHTPDEVSILNGAWTSVGTDGKGHRRLAPAVPGDPPLDRPVPRTHHVPTVRFRRTARSADRLHGCCLPRRRHRHRCDAAPHLHQRRVRGVGRPEAAPPLRGGRRHAALPRLGRARTARKAIRLSGSTVASAR